MTTINERINELIAALGIKKTDLAKRLKIADASVSNICSGKTNPSGQTITAIVREFNVNEHWLRTGDGDMFLPRDEADELAELFASIMNTEPSSKIRRLAVAFSKLTPEQREAIADLAESFAEKYK